MNSFTVIFDGDDTLWRIHFLYRRAKEKASEVAHLSVNKDDFIRKIDERSVAFAERYGFTIERFPTALCQAYEFFLQQQTMEVDPVVRQQIWDIGWAVNFEPPQPMPSLYETLDQLVKRYHLVLYTLGESDPQLKKVEALGLRRYFKEDDIFTVLHKGEEQLHYIISKLDLVPKATWMVGNSARSDIIPAQKAGLNCLWILTEQWLYDEADIVSSEVYKIRFLHEIPPLLEKWAADFSET